MENTNLTNNKKITKEAVIRVLDKIDKRVEKNYLVKQRQYSMSSSTKDFFKTMTI